jgi:DNA-binding NarL/FixJ family response regulator
LHALFPEVPILAFSNRCESLYAERALRLGAKGYVSEQTGPDQFVLAAKRLLAGHAFVPEAVAEQILVGMAASRRNAPGSPLHLLSERELQVFEMIGEGKSIPDVSCELAISRKTVGTHLSHIRQKLSARNAYDLLAIAFRWVQAQKA